MAAFFYYIVRNRTHWALKLQKEIEDRHMLKLEKLDVGMSRSCCTDRTEGTS